MASFTSWFFGDRCEFCGTLISEQDEIIAKSTPLLSVTNAEQAEAFPIIDQEEKGETT